MGRPAIEVHRHLPDGTVLTRSAHSSQDLQVDARSFHFFVEVVAGRDPSPQQAGQLGSSSSRSK